MSISNLVELVGMVLVVGALALFDWRLGVLAAGVVLVVIGMALDRVRA